MPIETSTHGIAQLDILIRQAVILGLRELRKNPDLLEYCFASLPKDQVTADQYGQSTVDRVKEWFIKTDIPVSVNLRIGKPKFPCVTIEIREQQEAEATLGDVNYDPAEYPENPWPDVTPAFSATYDTTTGDVKIPKAIADAIFIAPGMVLVDRNSQTFTITDAIDDTTVRIATGQKPDFGQVTIRYGKPANIVTLESCVFRGTIGVGCHVQGEAEQLLWLHSIVMFILLRYKQQYLEARGFERSTLNSTTAIRDDSWGAENIFSQYVNMTGFWRNYWPKLMGLRPQGINIGIKVADGGTSPSSIDVDQQAWGMEQDVLAGITTTKITGSSK